MRWFQRKTNRRGSKSTKTIGKNVRIVFPEQLELGNYVYIGEDSYIQAQGGIVIGDHSILGPRTVVLSHHHNYKSTTALPYDEEEIYRPVNIGKYVYVGMGSMIFPGVSIGDAAVLEFGSVVTRDVSPMSIVRGNPAIVVGQRDAERTQRLMREQRSYLMKNTRPPYG